MRRVYLFKESYNIILILSMVIDHSVK